jgi:hypothetical protein
LICDCGRLYICGYSVLTTTYLSLGRADFVFSTGGVCSEGPPCRHRLFLQAPAPPPIPSPPPLRPPPVLLGVLAALHQQRQRSCLAFSSYSLRSSRPFCSWLSSGRSSNAVRPHSYLNSTITEALIGACRNCGRCGSVTNPERKNGTGRTPPPL